METNSSILSKDPKDSEANQIKGLYGIYTITEKDKIEVKYYRLSVLFCGLSYSACLFNYISLNSISAAICLIAMAISLGLALKWIHIYLKPLHQFLQFLWLIGCIGIAIMLYNFGLESLVSEITEKHYEIIFIGPLFASLAGLGFKEFFCFRRFEAIGLTILLPIALLGYLTNLIQGEYAIAILVISALLLVLMAIRKFGMDESDDIGDKSVFEYLAQTKNV